MLNSACYNYMTELTAGGGKSQLPMSVSISNFAVAAAQILASLVLLLFNLIRSYILLGNAIIPIKAYWVEEAGSCTG